MHLAYLDDSGTHDKARKFQVMAGVIINDRAFRDMELALSLMVGFLVPEEKRDEFEEFKAWELFGGCGPFDGVDREKRFAMIRSLLSTVTAQEIPIVYGAVDLAKLAKKTYASADPFDVCFRLCVQGIQAWAAKVTSLPNITDPLEEPLAVLICDDFHQKAIKDSFRKSFRQLRSKAKPPSYSSHGWHLHDDLYFGSSKDSIGIQLADLCAYVIRKHLEEDVSIAEFYEIIKEHIVSSKVEPHDVINSANDANAKGQTA